MWQGRTTHVGRLDGDKEDDVVLPEGVPLVSHLHAVKVCEVKRHLGQHLGQKGENRQKGKGVNKETKDTGKGPMRRSRDGGKEREREREGRTRED